MGGWKEGSNTTNSTPFYFTSLLWLFFLKQCGYSFPPRTSLHIKKALNSSCRISRHPSSPCFCSASLYVCGFVLLLHRSRFGFLCRSYDSLESLDLRLSTIVCRIHLLNFLVGGGGPHVIRIYSFGTQLFVNDVPNALDFTWVTSFLKSRGGRKNTVAEGSLSVSRSLLSTTVRPSPPALYSLSVPAAVVSERNCA